MKKKAPYLFLVFLALVLIFIIGVRYGQQVEKTNKVVDFIIKLTPSPSAIPTPTTAITYNTYKTCGIQFLYPDYLKPENESSTAAKLALKGSNDNISISCDKGNEIAEMLKDKKIASEEVKLKNKKVTAKVQYEEYSFELKNPVNGRSIYVTLDKNLFPLFESTLQYLP